MFDEKAVLLMGLTRLAEVTIQHFSEKVHLTKSLKFEVIYRQYSLELINEKVYFLVTPMLTNNSLRVYFSGYGERVVTYENVEGCVNIITSLVYKLFTDHGVLNDS